MSKFIVSYFFIILLLISGCHENSAINDPNENLDSSENYLFVAGEGSFYEENSGSITFINEYGDVTKLEGIGSTVHAVEVYGDYLLVSINQDQKILVYNISEHGLEFETEVLTGGGSPRDIMIINNKAYFPVWSPDYTIYPLISGHISVLDLETFSIIESVEVGIMPEGMMYKDGYLWVANSGGSTISKINITNNIVEHSIEVGNGPRFLVESNDDIYIARTAYDENWNPSYGATMISGDDIIIESHSALAGGACGGSIVAINNKVYRSFNGGIAEIGPDLQIKESTRMGDFNQSHVNHVEIINNEIYFAITDFADKNEIEILDSFGSVILNHAVGIGPGDFAVWSKSR